MIKLKSLLIERKAKPTHKIIKSVADIIDSSPEEKAKSAKTAMLFSRANTLLSFPMLLSMVAAQNLY